MKGPSGESSPYRATLRKIASGWLFSLLIFITLVGCSAACADNLLPTKLRCEYLDDPLGVGELYPRLTWCVASAERNQKQRAYRILVASTSEMMARNTGDLWDSGKIASDETVNIAYAGTPLESRQECFWKVCVWDKHDAVQWSAPASWTMGLLKPADWRAKWIGLEESPPTGPDETATPRYLRKEFTVERQVYRATIYATALGLYELHLNGGRVGDALLAPEWTNYRKRVQYQTYDVTKMLHVGTNAIAAMLGNGWYCGHWQMWKSKLQSIYGSQPYLRAQLEIDYTDGSRQLVGSDDSWRGTTRGPLRFSGIYEGETYDARKQMPGWDSPGFDDRNWQPATAANPRAGGLVWQRSEPIRVTRELRPVSVKEPKPGMFVFDLGQNMAGSCRLRLHEPEGTLVTLKFNEMLNPDGTVYMDNLHAGHLSQGDRQIIRYTCHGGGEETYEPHFTCQGFRYVEVSGLTARPATNFLVGRVFHTSFERVGSFTCSNELLNQLAQNIQWSQRANMMGVPTDCCQRDERCGYTGDMNFFMPTAVYNFDVAAFFHKWLVDLCEDSQLPDGHFADHAPTFGPGDGWNVGWADAGIICPWVFWQTYGDTNVIREHYSAMRRFVTLLANTSSNYLHVRRIGNGDWLNLGGGADEKVIGTAYDALDFRLMAGMAQAIGEIRDAAEYGERAKKISAAFAKAFIDADGKIQNSSQTGYALAFTMALVPPDKKTKMAEQFIQEIENHDWHLATGFIGTPRLLPALHLAGRDDVAYRLLLNETYPSWLYPVTLGATTIWERWNGWTPENGFADSGMNSFNHYALGSVGQYLFSVVGGIQAASPGFKQIRIEPVSGPGLTWARCSYESIRGKIESDWKVERGGLQLDVTIPANTMATVVLPATGTPGMIESGKPIRQADGIQSVRLSGGKTLIQLGSGQYSFHSAMN